MTSAELSSLAFVVGLAIAASLACVLAVATFLQLEQSIGKWVAALIVPSIALAIALSSLLSGRDLKYAFANIEAMSASSAEGSTQLLRAITVVLIGLCGASIIARLFRKGRQPPQSGQILLVAFLIFFICNEILNSIFGSYPAFAHNSLYVSVVFLAIYMNRNEPVEEFIRTAKVALLALMIASLAAAVLVPTVALEPNYKSWIPGVNFRLWGVGSNPNSIGPLALLLVLLELEWRSTTLPWRTLTFGLALAVLLLAQSKTALGAGLVMVPILLWYRIGRGNNGRIQTNLFPVLIGVLILATLALVLGDFTKFWASVSTGQMESDVSSLSGRVQIWSAAINAWRENPLFGYGPLAWGSRHRATIGMPFAFSAHNQFLQSLSVAGAMGLMSFVAYLSVLALFACRCAGATHGASLAILFVELVRCVTEAPFSAGSLFNGDTLTQLVLFRIGLFGAVPSPKNWPASRSHADKPRETPETRFPQGEIRE